MPKCSSYVQVQRTIFNSPFFFFGLAIELTLIFVFNLLTFLVGIFVSAYSLLSSDEL